MDDPHKKGACLSKYRVQFVGDFISIVFSVSLVLTYFYVLVNSCAVQNILSDSNHNIILLTIYYFYNFF